MAFAAEKALINQSISQSPCLQDILKIFCIIVSSSLFMLWNYEFTYGLRIAKPIILIIYDKDPNINDAFN